MVAPVTPPNSPPGLRLIGRRRALSGLAGLAGIAATASLAGCGQSSQSAEVSRVVRYQGWPQTVLFAELAQDLGYLPTAELKYIGNTTSGPQDIQTVATGDSDIGHAFSGAVIKLVEAGIPIRAASNYYGSDEETYVGLYSSKDADTKNPLDLIGKTVGMNTLGAHSEAFIFQLLEHSGATPEQVKNVTLVPIPPSDIEISILRGHIDAGVIDGIAQDLVREHGTLREMARDVDLFGKFSAGQMVMRQEWIDQNPGLAREVAHGSDRAVRWATEQPREKVVERMVKIVSDRGRGEDPAPLQYWKSTGLTHGGIMQDNDFTRWEEWLRTRKIVSQPVEPGKYYTNDLIRQS